MILKTNLYFNCRYFQILFTINVLSQILIQVLKNHSQTILSVNNIIQSIPHKLELLSTEQY